MYVCPAEGDGCPGSRSYVTEPWQVAATGRGDLGEVRSLYAPEEVLLMAGREVVFVER